jgi:hypothetical protein
MKNIFTIALAVTFSGLLLFSGTSETKGQSANRTATFTLSWAVAPSANTPQYRTEHYSVWVSSTGTDVADFTMVHDETLLSTHTNWVYETRTVTLDYQTGTQIYVAFRHHQSTDKDRITIDNVKVLKTENDEETTLFMEDFETYADNDAFVANSNWMLVDADGDSNKWYHHLRSTTQNKSLISDSYDGAAALTPDNWAITPQIQLGQASSVNPIANKSLFVYPNPFKNNVVIEGGQDISRVTVLIIIGQVVMDVQVTNETTVLNTNSLPNGVYMFTFTTANGEKTSRKMIKN